MGLSNVEIADQLEICRPTVISILQKAKEHMELRIRNGNLPTIGVDGCYVEMDETHLVSRRDIRGRIMPGERYWLLGVICRETKQQMIKLVRNRNRHVINEFMQYVNPRSHVITDEWRGYVDLRANGFAHTTINHSQFWVDPINRDIHTQTIESNWSILKRNLPIYTTFEDYERYVFWFMIHKNLELKRASQKFEYYITLFTFN